MASIISGILFSISSIVLGAFAHHALQDQLSDKELQAIQVASRYLFYNAIPLLLLFFTNQDWKWPKSLIYAFIFSGLLFSGSILILIFTNITIAAYFTPLGGLGMILSWAWWLGLILKKFNKN